MGRWGLRKRQEAEAARPECVSLEDMGSEMSGRSADALAALKQFEQMHELDPNLPLNDVAAVDDALHGGNAEKGIEVEQALVEDNSPYPEVRAAVRNDDYDAPANTIRAWVIGMLLCTIGSAVNMVLSLRNPSILLTTFVIQLVAYPIGRGWDLIFPDRVWRIGPLRFNLRPGRFNMKEHVVITVMSNAAYGGGALYATDVIIAQKMWYGEQFGWAWQVLLAITTLCTGYGLAGLARRFLVWPAAMIWPTDLVNCALFHTLHDHSPSDPSKTGGWTMGRYKWFLIVFGGSFVWYFFPGWLFQGLQWFCWLTWIWPQDVIVNQLFGGMSGYGLLPLSFDWTIISGYLTSPLMTPFFAIANVLAGIFIFFIVVSMGIHYSNVWYGAYLPVQNSHAYDNTGQQYEVSLILTDNAFDEEKYMAYSPLYLPTQFALAYGLAFAAIAAVLVHVALYHGKSLRAQLRLGRRQEDDVHMRLMKKYRDASDWWYAVLFGVMVILSFVVVCAWPTSLPWWAYIVCMLLPAVWLVPMGIIQAVTNIQMGGLNVLTEFVVGYMLPGRPLAMMIFKNYGCVALTQAIYFAQDLKLGHYMKVPPRTLFAAQLVASVWSAIVQIAAMNWALGNIPGICTTQQDNQFYCPNARVFYTASVIWGAIGPRRMFSSGALYSSLQWFWLIGALGPIATWFLARRYPRSLWRYVNLPVVFGGSSGWIPPATVYIYLCWGTVGTFFNFFIKRRRPGWWMQYNYVTSAALDTGLVVGTFFVFFALYLPGVQVPVWFGNYDAVTNLDTTSAAVQVVLPPGDTFGPTSWP